MRPLKFLIGLFLLPVVWTAIRATARLIATLRIEEFGGHPQAAWWLAGGFLFWLLLYLLLPRPMRTYVLGHELTHAFWALLMGARVSRLRVTARGGSVTISKSNWIITLAPYFFPFYTMLVIASVFALGLFFNLQPYERLILAIIGFTYA
ncbi:MAG: M50 family metallopeptidase, partial [Kiritimatiellae bacterium]|nr:M50 family metallopeptidase [Kiritimatiellia bacterium]